jgi:hypothetical protein
MFRSRAKYICMVSFGECLGRQTFKYKKTEID